MQSIVQTRGHVSFPSFSGERVYMRSFTKAAGLPADLKRWQPTVDQMLNGIDTDLHMYLMVDQTTVRPGLPQRRPGRHIDGYWMPATKMYDEGYTNVIKLGYRTHLTAHNGPGDWDNGNRWKQIGMHRTRHITGCGAGGWAPEAILLASDVVGCDAYEGEWEGKIGNGGDCSHLDLLMRRLTLPAGRVHALNVTGLHESIPLVQGGERTLVRINVPGWSPEFCL